MCVSVGALGGETWMSIPTWTVFQSREGFADADIKAARLDSICMYGGPGAVPDQVPQVILVTMGI